jgi:eukaryotic-like serine/threonine-protein kinase
MTPNNTTTYVAEAPPTLADADPFGAWERDFQAACARGPLPSVAELRTWLGRIPAGDRPDLLPGLVALHVRASWRAGAEPDLAAYVKEFGPDFPEFASLEVLPAEVFQADLLARYEFVPGREQRTVAEYAADHRRPDVADLVRESAVGEGGRYVTLSKLGMGGMGVVWKCHDQHLRRLAAVKFPKPGVVWNARARQRLAREARRTAGLNHPGIVSVYEFDESDPDRPFYVMRLVLGDTLQDRVRAHFAAGGGRHGRRELVQLLVSVCEAVAYAHAHHVWHRDLKPGNVKVGEFGEVTVLDWGLLKVHQAGAPEPEPGAPALPASGQTTETPANAPGGTPPDGSSSGVVGSLAYMPPEQARGESDPRSDLFSLGAILYEILTGRPPYAPEPGESPAALFERVQAARFARPRKAGGRSVPRALEAVCLKALAPRPADRYGSAEELAADLRRWLADEPVRAGREWPHDKLLRLIRRHTAVAALLALVAIGLVAGLWGRQLDLAARAREADRELGEIDALVAAGDLDQARTALVALEARLHGPEGLRGPRERARRTLEQVEARSRLDREIQVRIPEFHRLADEAEYHLLGAYWTLLPHEDPEGSRRIGYKHPRDAALDRGVTAAREALSMYGLPDPAAAIQRLREAGLAEGTFGQLRQRAGEVLFLWALAVERLAQGGPPDRHADARREAVGLLEAAERCGNTSASLYRCRADFRAHLGDEAGAAADRAAGERKPDATFLDHHLRGARHARKKEYEPAIQAFQRALAIRYRDYWTLYRLAKTLELYGTSRNDPVYLGQAEALFATCAGLRPDDPTASNNRGDVLKQLRRFEDAAAMFEKVLEVDPGYLMAWGNLTLAHAERKDPAAAEAVLRRFTEHPGIDRTQPLARREQARVLAYVGLAYERVKSYPQANAYASRALELQPDFVQALRNRAIARENLGRLPEAAADIGRAIDLRPEDGELYYVRGNVLAGQRHYPDAVQSYDRAIELAPKLLDAWYNRGVVLRRLKRYEEAFRDQTHVIRSQPTYLLAYHERALIQAARGQFRGAADDLDALLALQPNDAPALVLRGKVHGDLGKDLERSERDLTRAIDLDPKAPDAFRSRGLTRSRARNWDGAIADYRQYLRLAPDAPDTASILNDIGIAYQNLDQMDEALRALGEAIALAPRPAYLCNRGYIHLERGDLDRAAADFEEAIRRDRTLHRAWGLRTQVRLRQEDWAGAIADLNRAEQLVPGYYEMFVFRGLAYYAVGDAAAARKDWARVVKDRPDHVRGKFCRGGLLLLDGRPLEAVEGLGLALEDTVLRPYALLLLARAWVELPGPGARRAAHYADELVRARPKDAAAYLEAARVHARAAARADAEAIPGLRNRALELLAQALERRSDLRGKLSEEPAFAALRQDPRFPK